jgi:small subunit ribosomal protein S6
MKTYELTYLISSELSEEEAKEFQGKVTSLIQAEGGVLVEQSSLLRKKLAYPIKKQTQAYLAILVFQSEPEKIANLEKKLKSENQILRYLILTKKELKVVSKAPRIPPLPKKPKVVVPEKEKKVELKEIEKKLEEILNEPQ